MFYFMKKISIHRTSTKPGAKNYTVVSNEILQSENLTFEACGLLTYLLSLPIDFTIVQKNILKKCSGRISKGSFYTAWKGLVEKGYIVKVIQFKNNLKRDGWEVYEVPPNRDTRNQESREPSTLKSIKEENINIESKNIEYKKDPGNNTGPSILDQNNLNENSTISKGTSSFNYYSNQYEAAVTFLYDATKLKQNIFKYASRENIPQLKEIIGPEEYLKIKPQLEKYIDAVVQLGWA